MNYKILSLVFCVCSLQISPLKCTPAVTTLSPVKGNSINGDEYEEIENHTLAPGAPEIEVKALQFLKDVNNKSFYAYRDFAIASWNYETDVTNKTEETKVFVSDVKSPYILLRKSLKNFFSFQAKAEASNYQFEADIQKEVEEKFPDWLKYKDPVLKRMFSNFAVQGPGNMSQEHIEQVL